MESETYQVMKIEAGTTVDGPGFRTSVYFAGCNHHCPGCQNPQTWDADAGETMTADEIMARILGEGNDVTFSGGDPLLFPEKTARLARRIREAGLGLWIYTGYTWEEILASDALRHAVAEVDVIVEGRFIEALRDPDLLFRGSSNQRLLAVSGSPDNLSATPYISPWDAI